MIDNILDFWSSATEVLGERVYNVVGGMPDGRCYARGGRLLRSRFASECHLARHQDQQREYPFHRFLHEAVRG
jgi:hypothetical protein